MFVVVRFKVLTNVQKQQFGSQASLNWAANMISISRLQEQENQDYEIENGERETSRAMIFILDKRERAGDTTGLVES